MFYITQIKTHRQLQNLAESISALYLAEDHFILRSAVLEVLQNTLQHSDGRFGIELSEKSFTLVNMVKKNKGHNRLGLKLFSGILTKRVQNLFFTKVYPQNVSLNELEEPELMELV